MNHRKQILVICKESNLFVEPDCRSELSEEGSYPILLIDSKIKMEFNKQGKLLRVSALDKDPSQP